jgi:DNA-binding CsgD family transcriptional regulator
MPDDTITIDRSSAAIVWQDPALVGKIFDGLTHAPPGWLAGYLSDVRSAGRCLLTSEVDPERKLSYRSELARGGVHDGINVCCLDLDREGFLLSLGIPSGIGFTPEVRNNLSKVATHILAARRLRKRLAGETAAKSAASVSSAAGNAATPASSAAVLSPDGALLDAQGEAKLADARRALRTAVLDVERARTALRHEPGSALALWKGLVSARWTLVDEFDSHGSKYVVARENAPRPKGLVSLTPTERCVVTYAARGYSTKEVAYTLGISATTVRVLLMRAVRRCGVASRDELLQLCRQAEGNTGS